VEGISPTIKHLNFIQTLSNVILVAIENIRLHNESLKQEALRKELELASRMQTMLIPDPEILPRNEHIKIDAFYSPHLEIGGDYYDFIEMEDNEIGFCIADVSGKGISAALLMSNFQANLRALFTAGISLADLIGILNNRVMVNTKGEKFITLFIGKYNYDTHLLEYVNAGHNPPLMYEIDSNTLHFLNKGCVGMGMLEEIPIIKKGEHLINQRTKLLCYTDGLVELLDETGVEFGTKEIEHDLKNEEGIEVNIKNIIKNHKIYEDASSVFDDISILALEFLV
jgi:sigma-B regulation protein RsbU (phosphoserine phosphatase)